MRGSKEWDGWFQPEMIIAAVSIVAAVSIAKARYSVHRMGVEARARAAIG